MKRTIRLAVLCICFAVTAHESRAADEPQAQEQKWHSWFEFGGYYNSRDGDGSGTSRGEASVFIPLIGGQRDLLFGQVTGKFFEDDIKEGNVAVGFRHMTASGFNFGAWVGADIRETGLDNQFWQLSGGFEALSHDVDARLNWYGPTSDPEAGGVGFTQAQIVGNQIVIIGGQEVALMGIDGEIGVRLPLEYGGFDADRFELRVYGGGYHFDASEALRSVTGVKGRVELRINDFLPFMPGARLTTEYEFSNDDARDTQHEVGLRVRIPLGDSASTQPFGSLTHQERRMLDGIERDTDIVTVQSEGEKVEDALTGTDFDRVAVVADGGDLTGASAAAGDNSLIILNGEVVGAQILEGDQTLQGGGTTIQVRGLTSGAVASFSASGAAGRLTTPGAADNLTLNGSNIHVAGITVVGDGAMGSSSNDGIEMNSDKTNMFITSTTITDVGDNAIDVDDGTTLAVFNTTVARTGNDGIEFDDENTITVIGGSVTDVGDEGVDGEDDNTVSVSEFRVTNSGDNGISLTDNNTVSITSSTLVNSGTDGISVENENVVSLSGVTIDGAFDDGIEMLSQNTVNVTDSAITNTAFGLYTFGVENNISFSNVRISEIDFAGVLIVGPDNTVRVVGSQFANIGLDAFDLFGLTTLLVQDTTFSGTFGGDIFRFSGPDSTILGGSVGNVNTAVIGGRLCEAGGGPNAFTGTIEFTDGTTLVDDIAPCN